MLNSMRSSTFANQNVLHVFNLMAGTYIVLGFILVSDSQLSGIYTYHIINSIEFRCSSSKVSKKLSRIINDLSSMVAQCSWNFDGKVVRISLTWRLEFRDAGAVTKMHASLACTLRLSVTVA